MSRAMLRRVKGDYIAQITFLLFLKMADEKGIELPKGWEWPTLRGA